MACGSATLSMSKGQLVSFLTPVPYTLYPVPAAAKPLRDDEFADVIDHLFGLVHDVDQIHVLPGDHPLG